MAELAHLITQLADENESARRKAAAELYGLGGALVAGMIETWRVDPELAELLAGPLTIGLAVLPAAFEKIRAAMGSPPLADVPPDQDAREFEVRLGPASLDILTTRDLTADGAMARFLKRFGEGIQQVECPTRNVDRATQLLRARFGWQPIYPATQPGANRTRVNFFLVTNAQGKKVLLELVEAP